MGEKVQGPSFNIFAWLKALKELETHIILCGEVGLMAEAEVANLLGRADGNWENATFDDQEPATEVMKHPFPYSLFATRYSLRGAY